MNRGPFILTMVALLPFACAPSPPPDAKPPPTVATASSSAPNPPTSASASASASAFASASASHANIEPPEPPFFLPPLPRLRATVTMAMDGNILAAKLPIAINRQIQPMARCVALLRKTDKVTGSLNLQIVVDGAGAVTPALQSPANPNATKCILDGAHAWSLPSLGAGTAMVLLDVEEDTGPSFDTRACVRDDECTVSNFPGCCSCGEDRDSPVAIHKETLRKQIAMCASVDCAPCEGRRVASPPSPQREPIPKGAVCRGGRCIGLH